MVVVDFIKFNNDAEPMFCIKRKRYDYEDGSSKECIGLGYRAITYNRTSKTGKQFGPFWMKTYLE